jgi:hypothetical protein
VFVNGFTKADVYRVTAQNDPDALEALLFELTGFVMGSARFIRRVHLTQLQLHALCNYEL